jgi:hypothetical protein
LDIDFVALVADFVEVARLSGFGISTNDISHEVLPNPHRRPQLPRGKKAAYVFCIADKCLKVGKVGSNSNARFSSQHYIPASSRSNLAKSLLADIARVNNGSIYFTPESCKDLTEVNIGRWIEQNATRHHFFMDDSQSGQLLSLLEVFLQCRLRPIYERG